ncbi:MAG: hypothetical protein HGA65_15745, partial [Oscillochloris sp.]|nr:hypothetical protein [Oscillochloris sp.]
QLLYVVGFDNQIIGDWSLLNPERIALVAVALVLLLVVLVTGALVVLG